MLSRMPSTWPVLHNEERKLFLLLPLWFSFGYISSVLYTIHLLSKFLFSFSSPWKCRVELTFFSLDMPQIFSKCSWSDEVLDLATDPALLSLGLTKVDDYSVKWSLCGVIAWVSAVAWNYVHCVGFQFNSNRL